MRFAWFWMLPAVGAALVPLSAGKPQAVGKPSFSDSIRPILAAKCVSCHHADGLGPFPLQTYEQVRKRGDLVRQVALTGQMPPTDARSDFLPLTQCPPLEPKELLAIQEWFRLGMPKGREALPLPAPPKRRPSVTHSNVTLQVGRGQVFPAEGRAARLVYEIPIPAGGLDSLSYFTFQPDSPKAVRQVLLAIQRLGQPVPFTSGGVRKDVPVMAWSEGFNAFAVDGASFRVAEGDRLWLQLKAVPTGKVEPASGLIAYSRVAQEPVIVSKSIGNNTFTVDADSQVVLRDEWVLESDIDLISATPEARFATEQVKLSVKEDGQVKTVFTVLTWDPVWPGAYNFGRQIRLKKGATLIYEAMINNSKHGHAAEDEKPKALKFGPRAQDELFWCHLNYIPRS